MTISQFSDGVRSRTVAGAVDVALHDVAAEAAAERHGALEVDAGAGGAGRRGWSGSRVSAMTSAVNSPPSMLDDGEADAVDGDGVAVLRALGDDGAAQPEAGGVAEVLDGGDLAQFFDDSGEHFPGPPASSGTDSGACR